MPSSSPAFGQRAEAAFDPFVGNFLAGDAAEMLRPGSDPGVWDEVLASEPTPWLVLTGQAIDRALAAIGHFSDMAINETVGHSGGVARVCRAAASAISLDPVDEVKLVRAALAHDLGRVGVPVRVWEKTSPLGLDEWERVRLHAYHTERILAQSPFLAGLGTLAGVHHERIDGSGYHRGVGAASLDPSARLLAAADAYHAMTEPTRVRYNGDWQCALHTEALPGDPFGRDQSGASKTPRSLECRNG
jgi:HD-GYP domain-containing protein (c-di-GMP phosphodiesterase class II)